jgi:hypothetical protein
MDRLTGEAAAAYQRGYDAGVRDANRNQYRAVAAIVMAAGGEVRVAHEYLVDDIELTASVDPVSQHEVYRAVRL